MQREVTQTELARILPLTTRQIHNLERQGMPCRARGNRKLYPLPDAVDWYIRRKQDEARADAESTDYEEARARREAARARLAEIEVAKAEGRLIPQDVVEEVFGDRLLDVLRAAIRNMPGRWGAQIVGLESPREGEAALKRIGSELLETLSGASADALERDDSGGLPADFPGRAALVAAGIETMSDLLGVDDLCSLPGVGPATERKIRQAMRGLNDAA